MASIDELYIKILADGSQLSPGLSQAQSKLDGFSSNVTKIGGLLAGAFSVVAVERFVSTAMNAYEDSARAQAKITQAIKSTGGAANLSLKELTDTASEFQKSTLFEDDTILNDVSAQLLSFTNIAGTNFLRAQEAAMNLSTVLDGDLKSASIQLGKALNDPVKGLTALSRSGIQFSAEQTALIKSLAETNRVTEAQTLILNELDKQYGGQARAAADASNGVIQLKNAFGDLMENIGGAISKSSVFNGVISGLKTNVDTLTTDNFNKLEKFFLFFDPWAAQKIAYRNLLKANKEAADKNTQDMIARSYGKLPEQQAPAVAPKKDTTLADLKQELADLQAAQSEATASTIKEINKSIEAKKAEIKKWEESGVAVNNYKGSIKGLQIELDALNQKRDTAIGTENIAAINDQITKKQEEIDILKKTTAEWIAYGKSMASAITTMSAIPAKLPEPENKPELQSNADKMAGVKENAQKDIDDMKALNDQMNSVIQNGLADMVGSMLESAMSGGDVGKAMLGTFGAVLSQLGKMVLMTGLGVLAAKTALKTLNPFVAIAAGVGLMALGAAFSSGAKSLGNSMGSGGGGGYGSGGSGNTNFDTRTSGANSAPREVQIRLAGRDLVGSINANQLYYTRQG